MWMTELPPFVPFFLGAAFAFLARGWLRALLLLAVPVLGGLHLLTVEPGIHWQFELMGFELVPYRVDHLSLLFGYLFHIAAFLAVLFSLHTRDPIQYAAGLLYAGSALGAVFAGDLLTLFVFWELLAVTSVFLVWARRTPAARASGFRYLIVQVFSGVLLLAGALAWLRQTGSLEFVFMGLDGGVATGLVFTAIGIKSAFPLLHNWVTDAYAEATPGGTVFLSAFTTKVAVYALARAFPGTEALIYIGAAMAMFPIFYAVIENDLRRVLAYSMINQVGFMVCGIGIGTSLALNGAVAHAFNDVIFKGLLFMSMGAVLHMTGRINGSDLGGLYKSMPWTTTFCIVGAASISAFPLFSGFVSKSMVMTSAQLEGYPIVWLALLFASAGVFHHAGIKIPYFAFFAHDSGIRTTEPPRNMLAAMGLAAALCILIGSYPSLLYGLLPYEAEYHPYTTTHVLAQLQLLFFSALAFVWLNLTHRYPPELRSTNLDAEWVYRWLAPRLLHRLGAAITAVDGAFRTVALRGLSGLTTVILRQHRPQGVVARTWPIGSMVMWVAVLLAVFVLVYYL